MDNGTGTKPRSDWDSGSHFLFFVVLLFFLLFNWAHMELASRRENMCAGRQRIRKTEGGRCNANHKA